MDRQRVIEIALENYWQWGLSDLSLSEVCRRVGISKPTLYREFGGEDGLHTAVLDHYRERVVVPALRYLEQAASFAEALEGAIVGLTSDRATPPGCLFTKMRLATSRLGPVAKKRVRALEDEHHRAYEALFRRGLAAKQANAELSPEFAARYIDTQIATVLVQMALGIAPALIREHARLALAPLLPRD